MGTDLRHHLFTPLAHLRQRCRLYLSLRGARWMILALIGAALGQLALDRWLRLSVDQRAVLNIVINLYWLWAAYWRLFVPLRRPLPNELLAALVDRAHPALGDRLSTAVQLSAGLPGAESGADGLWADRARSSASVTAASPALTQEVLRDACRAAATVPFLSVLSHRRATRCLFEAFGLLLLVVLAFGLLPELTGTWFARNWLLQDVAWPQRTYIWPDGFGVDARRRLARGDVAEISATVTGEVPGAAVLEWWTPSERRGRESMSLVGDTQLVTSLGQLSEDICFRIVGGDEHTREFVIEATERPCVMHTLARITPPAYTHLDPAVIEQQTVLEILQGSTLELVARLNKAVKSARFVDSDGLAVPCEITWTDAAEPQPCVRVLWPEPSSGVYRFELVDYDHLANRNPVRYTLKAVPDRPPTVQMELTGVGELVTPQAELPVELRCEDAYGLKAVRLRAEVVAAGASATGPAAASAPEGFSPGSRSFSTKLAFSVGSSGTVAGDRVRLWAEAEDINPRGPNVAATSVTTLRVVSRDEFLMEMARRELGLRQEFERLRSTQRALKDSVERILPGLPEEGRPPEPVAQRLGGLARSQAEQASRSLAVARSFDQILTEMQVSRVARPADERRITERVVEPLGQLAREAMPAAADALTALRRAVTGEGRQACAAAQDALLRQMDEILANMLEWEGYREAVALLQEAIEAQTQVRSETLQALERQLEDILGLEPAAEDSRPAPAMP